MPRTRAAASPPPRRSGGGERARSVRRLVHPVSPSTPIVEEESTNAPAASLDEKHALILRHAATRNDRQTSGFGARGVAAVLVTCLVIFLGWRVVLHLFGESFIVHVSVPMESVATTTPLMLASTTTTQPQQIERRLLQPLTSPTSSPRSP